MEPGTSQDYKKLLTQVIQKQMVILGPTITLAKARNVKGLTVADDGTVVNIVGQPQELIQGLIDQFVQLSGLIVKKTMEPLLSAYPDGSSPIQTPQVEVTTPVASPTQTAQTPTQQSATKT